MFDGILNLSQVIGKPQLKIFKISKAENEGDMLSHGELFVENHCS